MQITKSLQNILAFIETFIEKIIELNILIDVFKLAFEKF